MLHGGDQSCDPVRGKASERGFSVVAGIVSAIS